MANIRASSAPALLSAARESMFPGRGPKRGHGRVINELRARDGQKEGEQREQRR